MKKINQQRAIEVANRIMELEGIKSLHPFCMSFLKLFEGGSNNAIEICRSIIEMMAVYENHRKYRKYIGSDEVNSKAVLKIMVMLYKFFNEIDNDKLQANLHILKLQEGWYSKEEIEILERYYSSSQKWAFGGMSLR